MCEICGLWLFGSEVSGSPLEIITKTVWPRVEAASSLVEPQVTSVDLYLYSGINFS